MNSFNNPEPASCAQENPPINQKCAVHAKMQEEIEQILHLRRSSNPSLGELFDEMLNSVHKKYHESLFKCEMALLEAKNTELQSENEYLHSELRCVRENSINHARELSRRFDEAKKQLADAEAKVARQEEELDKLRHQLTTHSQNLQDVAAIGESPSPAPPSTSACRFSHVSAQRATESYLQDKKGNHLPMPPLYSNDCALDTSCPDPRCHYVHTDQKPLYAALIPLLPPKLDHRAAEYSLFDHHGNQLSGPPLYSHPCVFPKCANPHCGYAHEDQRILYAGLCPILPHKPYDRVPGSDLRDKDGGKIVGPPRYRDRCIASTCDRARCGNLHDDQKEVYAGLIPFLPLR